MPSTSYANRSDSLSLLLPRSSISTPAKRHDPEYEAHCEELLGYSRDLLHCFNTRQYDKATTYLSPKFRARHGNLAVEMDREQHMAAHRLMAKTNPSWKLNIVAAHADVNYIAGNAMVWVFVKVTGDEEGVSRDSLGTLHWVRDGKTGVWEIRYHEGFRSCVGLFS